VTADLFVGVGGIGWGQLFRLEGTRTIGRNESRNAVLVDARDYCKLHIVFHWLAVLTRGGTAPRPRITPIGIVGDDEPGHRLLGEMEAVGLDTGHVGVASNLPTTFSVALQYPDGSGCNVTTSNGAAASLTPEHAAATVRAMCETRPQMVAVALPEVPVRTRLEFLAALDGCGAFRVAAFTSAEVRSSAGQALFDRVDLLAMNEDEAGAFLGQRFDATRSQSFLDDIADQMVRLRPELCVVMTAGAHGAFAFQRGQWDHCPALPTRVIGTAGAGDAFLAGVLAGLFAGLPLANPSRSSTPLPERGVCSAIDVGVLAATYKLGSKDTIPSGASAGALAEFGRELGVTEMRWPDPTYLQRAVPGA
jgi:sugar/nucleoside kinase (ribokinase family)